MEIKCPKCNNTNILKLKSRLYTKKSFKLDFEPKFYHCLSCGKDFNIK